MEDRVREQKETIDLEDITVDVQVVEMKFSRLDSYPQRRPCYQGPTIQPASRTQIISRQASTHFQAICLGRKQRYARFFPLLFQLRILSNVLCTFLCPELHSLGYQGRSYAFLLSKNVTVQCGDTLQAQGLA